MKQPVIIMMKTSTLHYACRLHVDVNQQIQKIIYYE